MSFGNHPACPHTGNQSCPLSVPCTDQCQIAVAERRGMVPPSFTTEPPADRDEAIADLVAKRVKIAHTWNRDQLARFMAAHNMLAPECAKAGLDELLLSLGDQLVNREAEIRRLRDAILSARWRLAKGRFMWNGPCHECDGVLQEALMIHDPAEAVATLSCDHDWGAGQSAHQMDSQRCLRCGTWRE